MNQREKVALALRDVKTLPTLPDVAMRLLETSDDPNVSMQTISGIVEGDMSLASRVLKLVNSSYFGIRHEVTSVRQAVMIIGMTNLRHLVLSSAVLDLFDREGAVGDFDRGEFWKHSIAVAVATRALAQRLRTADSEVAFTAGLLHDMGKVVVDRYLHADFAKIVAAMSRDHQPMTDAEIEVLGVNHAEIGQHLAARWSLPEILRESVGYHHAPQDAPTHGTLAAVVSVADAMARRLGVGRGGGADHVVDEATLNLCGLDPQKLEAITSELGDVLETQVSEVTAER